MCPSLAMVCFLSPPATVPDAPGYAAAANGLYTVPADFYFESTCRDYDWPVAE